MICLRCLNRMAARPRNMRYLSTTPATQPAVSTSTPNSPSPPPRPSSSSATTTTPTTQSFSTQVALTPPSTPQQGQGQDVSLSPATKEKERPRITSSVPAGMTLKGLNYFKNKQDPVAMEDHEYPAWLWTLLDERKTMPAEGQKEEVDPRLFSKSANSRRIANKRMRALAKQNPEPDVPQVPLYEQSINLPVGEQSLQAREELTKSMRGKRRRDIKEKNFLKSMS